jgi:hypothetical protein
MNKLIDLNKVVEVIFLLLREQGFPDLGADSRG